MRSIPRAPSIVPQALQAAKSFFASHPWLTNCTVYGGLFTISEFLQQTMTKNKDEDYDLAGLGRYCIMATGPQASILHWWYVWLDGRYVGTSAAIISKKLALDIVGVSPPLFASFYVGMSLLEGQEDIFAECREKFLPTFSASCMFWTPAMAINFLVIPAAARMAFVGLCSLMWTNIMLVVIKMDWGAVKSEAKMDWEAKKSEAIDNNAKNSELPKATNPFTEQLSSFKVTVDNK